MKKYRLSTQGVLTLTACLAAPGALAQESAEPESLPTIAVDGAPVGGEDEAAPKREVRNRVVEEVVVTAQKREEKLQDVPISIQAFSGDAMAARGIENTYQLGQVVPSLQITDAAGFTLIFMRGIGQDNFIPSADPSIATYIDGIYVPQGQTAAQSLGNVTRVEVLKGPQGTLFGRNATGGAISIVTADPGNVAETSIETEFGNYNSRSIKASTTVPLTDWISVSGAGLIKSIDNYYTATQYEIPSTQTKSGRLKLSIHPSDDVSINLTGYKTRQKGYSSTIGNNTDPSLVSRTVGATAAEDSYNTGMDLIRPSDRATQDIYYGNVLWSTSLVDVKLLVSDQKIVTAPSSIDFDGTPIPVAAFNAEYEFSKLNTYELQFLSNAETPFSDRFQWVAGLYYLNSDAGFDPAHLRVAPGALTGLVGLAENAGLVIPDRLQSIASFINGLPLGSYTPLSVDGVTVQFTGIMGTESKSAYAQGTYFFNDYFDLTVGGRYQMERRFLTKSQTGVTVPATQGDGLDLEPLRFDLPSEKAKNFSPKVVLTAHPRENALFYLSYGVGYKSGTFNIVNIYTPPSYIKPERVETVELGMKMDFFNHLLRINGAIFNNQITDLQTGFVSILSGGAVQFINAGKSRTRGVEIDGTAMPLPDLNPGLAITFNAAYVKASYEDFDPCPGFREGTGVFASNLDCSGNDIVRSPKLSGSIGIVQAVDLDNGSLEFAIDEYYNSGFYYDAYNTVKEHAYTTLGSRVSYLYNPWNVRVTAYAKNMLGEEYHIQQFQTDFGITKTLAAPREYGLRLNWNF